MNNLCFGMKCINITQLPSGSYSHANKAVDLGGQDSGIDVWYARGNWKCISCWYSGSNTYHFVPVDDDGNVTKVHCADGVDRVVTVSLTHSNIAPKINHIYKNGEWMFQEGTKYPVANRVTGNHIHLEIAEGEQTQRYKDSKTNTWTLYGELNPLEVMFVDDSFSTIKSAKGATLHHCNTLEYSKENKGSDGMTLQDGYQEITSNGATYHVFKGYGDYKQLHMLSALGTETSTQDISKYDHDNMVIMALANCNYFEMSNSGSYGQHYGVEQSEGDGTHTTSLDLAPKNNAYQVVYQLKDGTIGKCTADNYYYSKSDVIFACTPYSIVVWDSQAINERSSAYGDKDSTSNSQTMYMYVGDSWCIVCTASKVTPAKLQLFATQCGAKYAFLVDSGGSTQMNAYTQGKWTKVIYTGRHIPDVLALAKVKDTGTSEPTEPTEETDYKKLYEELYSKYLELVKQYEDTYNDVTFLENKIEEIKKVIEGD